MLNIPLAGKKKRCVAPLFLRVVYSVYYAYAGFVVFVAIVDQAIYEGLKQLDVLLVAIHLDSPASGCKAQLGVERLEQQDIRVVCTVKNDRICLFQYDNFLNHGRKDTDILPMLQTFVQKKCQSETNSVSDWLLSFDI